MGDNTKKDKELPFALRFQESQKDLPPECSKNTESGTTVRDITQKDD